MRWIKTQIGKLEYDNYFSATDVADFIYDGVWHRDGNSFYLDGNTYIERKFDYQTFVLILKKENFATEIDGQEFISYVVDDNNQNYGIICPKGEQNSYHKLVFNDGFITAYSSPDGVTWDNLGGCAITGTITRQGFSKTHTSSARLLEYAVYADAFITIQDIAQGSTVELYDSSGTLIRNRIADISRVAKVFLDTLMQGYFKIYDPTGTLQVTTELLDLTYGDKYVLSEHDLDFLYEGKIITAEPKTLLDELYSVHRMAVKNSGTYDISNLKVSLENNTTDAIELSYNNATFTAELDMPLIEAGQTIEFYVRIIKGTNCPDFVLKDFIVKVMKK